MWAVGLTHFVAGGPMILRPHLSWTAEVLGQASAGAGWRLEPPAITTCLMRVLIVGGNRFVGYLLAWRLLAGGHSVSVMNRSGVPYEFAGRVESLRGDRTTGDFARLAGSREWDAVVDFACFTGAEARGAVEALAGRCGHYVMISTGQVYLVREPRPGVPFREADYAGAVMAAPPTPGEQGDWEYGVWKRDAEDVLAASPQLPSTRLRIPMVNGPRDYYRRIEKYLRRLLDGGPLLVPLLDRGCRHVYGADVAKFIATHLGDTTLFGQAINLADAGETPLRQILSMLADRLGAPSPRLVPCDHTLLAERGLTARDVSPFSGRWMSNPDPTLAITRHGWVPTPLERQLDTIVEAFVSNPPAEMPAGYEQRAIEIELAKTLG